MQVEKGSVVGQLQKTLSRFPYTTYQPHPTKQTRHCLYVQGAACPMDMVTGDGLLNASLPTDRKATKPPMAATERMMVMRVKLT